MDEVPSDRSSLTFFVSTTQSYRVVVVNRGLVWNQFAIRAD
jgi:hypothetical protein